MRLNSRIIASGGGLALLVGLLAIPIAAQEPKVRTKAVPPARVVEKEKVAHPPGVHVPDYFGQLDPPLTPEQRERIYEIQARALRECEAVLTAAQRSNLDEHRTKALHPARDAMPHDNEPRVRETRKKAG